MSTDQKRSLVFSKIMVSPTNLAGSYVVVTMTLSLTDDKIVSAQCQEEGLEISGTQSYLLSSYPLVLQYIFL